MIPRALRWFPLLLAMAATGGFAPPTGAQGQTKKPAAKAATKAPAGKGTKGNRSKNGSAKHNGAKSKKKGAAAVNAPRASAGATPVIELRRGLVITKSVKVKPKLYRLNAHPSTDSALIIVRGNDITVDLTDVTIAGAESAADPDRFAGVAIRVDGGRNITIKNGTIRGYRVAILARGTKALTVADAVLSHSWKPRLYSVVEHESLADWLSFHHNEKREWLRFGAALYLEEVSGGEIRNVTAEHGMNALLLVRTDHLSIHDNTFMFNSGLGVGMYRSTDNRLLHNRLDYNVRGFSNGFYRRGQDSAGLLMFEQSSRNVVAYNSATHGGDGLFLWAGQSTMDTGAGGSNDNLFFANDFSYAPTNALELTFSRNIVVANLAKGSDHGIWGGYSYDTKIVGNCFVRNRIGIAIEHGQDNLIAANRFEGDQTAVRLWADRIEPSDWQYPKKRDTQLRANLIADNVFSRHRVALNVANARGLQLTNNRFISSDTVFAFKDTLGVRMMGSTTGVATPDAADPCATMGALPPEFDRLAPQAEGIARTIPVSAVSQKERPAIIVDEWGPFDWRSPKLWPVDSTRRATQRLAVVGPEGKWTVASKRGIATLSLASGIVGDTIVVTPQVESMLDWELVLEYRGGATVSPRGETTPAGTAVRFSYAMFEPRQQWDVRFFTWSDSTDPRTRLEGFEASLAGTPIAVASLPRLDLMWYRPSIKDVPASKWAAVATSRVTVPAGGTYTLRTISDDAVRVWVDGRLVIDDWKQHESAVAVAPIAAGMHDVRVEYVQVEGWTELRLDIVRGTQRASGSPGPH